MILDNPARLPAPAQEVRRRLRPKPRALPNGNSKLTPAKVRKIRKDTRSSVEVAAALGVHKSTVSRVRNGQTWASVR